ncbi:hypothetical protein Tco_0969546 [Tanacetum coccineum]
MWGVGFRLVMGLEGCGGVNESVYLGNGAVSTQTNGAAQPLESVKSQLPTMVDDLLSTRIRYATRTALESYTKDFENKAHRLEDPKSSGKSAQEEEPVFETTDTEMPQDEGDDIGNIKDQPNVEATLRNDWFKKPERPPTPDPEWSATKFIDNLTQEILVEPAFNLIKGTCKSFVELEYHFEECYKAVMDQLDWNNPERHEYPFDLSKPLPLIKAQGRQVVPADYFFNNALEYLKDGSSSKNYTTSITKTKAARYDNIKSIEDMVPELWSPVKVAYEKYAMKRIIAVTHVKVMKWYGYGYLEEIIIRREDQSLHKFKEGDFPRLNLRDIEDLLLLLVQKKLSNLEQDVIFDLNVALRMFTRRIVILKRVEDLQLGVESYKKKLNITKPETFRSSISKLTPYTTYKNPQGIIYQDKFKRNRLMRSDELYKFCNSTLTYV